MKKQTEKDKLIALYERLSHDDERAGEFVSIEDRGAIDTIWQKYIWQKYTFRQKSGVSGIVCKKE